jgi:hypothetical protein
MFLVPLNAALKETETLNIWDNPEAAEVTAPTWHWLFCNTRPELISFESDPAAESQSNDTLPALRSKTMSQAFVTVALVVLNNIARPIRFAAFCVSENTNVKVWAAPLPPLGDTVSAEGTGGGITAVHDPRETHPVFAPASAAYR